MNFSQNVLEKVIIRLSIKFKLIIFCYKPYENNLSKLAQK